MVKLLYNANDTLGECPVWHSDEGALYWVDIEGKRIQRYVLESSQHSHWTTPERACGIAPRTGGGLVVALEHDLTYFDAQTNSFTAFASIDADKPENRNNDMKCDAQGHLWVGTMQADAQGRAGSLYRVDASGIVTPFLSDIGIANTLAWSPDETRFYFADSAQNIIWSFDYDVSSGDISNQQPFFEGGPGSPDGSAMDSQGYLWNARYGGACVLRIAPDGRVDKTLDVPSQNPTNCAFGGADLSTLFITSAGGKNAADPNAENHEGAVLSAEVDVTGTSVGKFAG